MKGAKGKGRGGADAEGDAPSDHDEQAGTMVRWNADKGFGFIKPDSGAEDVFCHVSKLVNGDDSVKQGERVVFRLEHDARKGKSCASQVRSQPPRFRCRYGAACYRANPEHRIEFTHPGDPDWDHAPDHAATAPVPALSKASTHAVAPGTASDGAPKPMKPMMSAAPKASSSTPAVKTSRKSGATASDGVSKSGTVAQPAAPKASALSHVATPLKVTASSSTVLPGPTSARPCCRYGADCYRSNAEHLNAFSHPGDSDWCQADTVTVDADGQLDNQSHPATCRGRDAEAAACSSALADDDPVDPSQEVMFTVHPPWLSSVPPAQLDDMKADLEHMAAKFGLAKAHVRNEGNKTWIELVASSTSKLDGARQELSEDKGLLDFHKGKLDWANSQSLAAVADVRSDVATLKSKCDIATTSASMSRPALRVDPEDGVARTFDEVQTLYKDLYSLNEISDYWDAMRPARSVRF